MLYMRSDSWVKTARSVLLYIVQYLINSAPSLEILSGTILCVCVSHFVKARNKVCRQNGTLSYRCRGQSSVKMKTCLQVQSMYLLEICHEADDSGRLSHFSISSCVIIDQPCLKWCCMLGEVHWGSSENLQDVTHPFLFFSFSSLCSLSECLTTHCFLTHFTPASHSLWR